MALNKGKTFWEVWEANIKTMNKMELEKRYNSNESPQEATGMKAKLRVQLQKQKSMCLYSLHSSL